MVNMVVLCPTHFLSEVIILTLGGKRTTPPSLKIYPQNLSTQYLVVWGSKSNKGGGGIFQILENEKLF